jgi:chromosome segregation ATPase
MSTHVLNGKPDQEFPNEQELETVDFQQIAHELSVATDRLRERSDTMETKYKILSTRLAAAEAATTHLNNQLEIVRTENAALRTENKILRGRMGAIERTIPPSETDVHHIQRDIDLLNRKIHALDSESNKRWYERILEYLGFHKDCANIDDVSKGV